jgi:hypothetical protein
MPFRVGTGDRAACRQGKVSAAFTIYITRNPDKLRHVRF